MKHSILITALLVLPVAGCDRLSPSVEMQSWRQQIEELTTQRDSGSISESEYLTLKRRLLDIMIL